MSAIALPRMCYGAPATATKSRGFFQLFLEPELAEKLLKAVVDDSLYEDANDVRPSLLVIVAAERTLSEAIDPKHRQHIEIDPGAGAIDITWRDRQRGRRVKATFGPDQKVFAVYHEQKHHGRVTDYASIPNARTAELKHWVRWCFGEV